MTINTVLTALSALGVIVFTAMLVVAAIEAHDAYRRQRWWPAARCCVTYDASCGYIGSAPELRQPIRARTH